MHRVQRGTGLLRNQQGARHSRRMNTSQIQCCIECDPTLRPSVIGVFAADQLPKALTKYPCCFIANTDIYSNRASTGERFTSRNREWLNSSTVMDIPVDITTTISNCGYPVMGIKLLSILKRYKVTIPAYVDYTAYIISIRD